MLILYFSLQTFIQYQFITSSPLIFMLITELHFIQDKRLINPFLFLHLHDFRLILIRLKINEVDYSVGV